MAFRVAVVQPISHPPAEAEKNVADAVRHVEQAAAEGAKFVCFPETYPGPWRMPANFDPTQALAKAAERNNIHVVFGTLEPIDEKAATAYNLICMAYPDGRPVARYRRTHPNGPWIYTGGRYWEFQYVPGSEYPSLTPPSAKSAWPCAARCICQRSRARWHCAGRRSSSCRRERTKEKCGTPGAR